MDRKPGCDRERLDRFGKGGLLSRIQRAIEALRKNGMILLNMKRLVRGKLPPVTI